jgi:SAM-dependent methyltransferase
LANLPAHRLAAWFASPAGSRVLREEADPLAEAVRRSHGDTLLWLGCHEAMTEAVRGCMVRSRLYGSVVPGRSPPGFPALQCAPESLPLPNNSLDALVLHHALETAEDPRGALREAARVVAPGGRLIICAFNPLSLWGLRRCFAQFSPDSFKGLHLLSTLRLLDWLALLGFEVHDRPAYLQYGLPFRREDLAREDGSREDVLPQDNALQRLMKRRRTPVGGIYLLSATKQVAAVRPHWRQAALRGARLPVPAYGATALGKDNVIRFDVSRARLPARD